MMMMMMKEQNTTIPQEVTEIQRTSNTKGDHEEGEGMNSRRTTDNNDNNNKDTLKEVSYYCKHQKQYYHQNNQSITPPPLLLQSSTTSSSSSQTRVIREQPQVRAPTEFPYPLDQHTTLHYLLNMNHTTLALTVRLPAATGKYITLLEFLPYRMVDGTTSRDTKQLPYLVGCGLATCRVDMRGTGDSEGVLLDEYLLQEQYDGEVLCEWIGEQSWSNGEVVMWGISWGGFNSLQIAVDRHPPSLKAIIPLAFSDHRYLTDVHYFGGFVHALEVRFPSPSLLIILPYHPSPLLIIICSLILLLLDGIMVIIYVRVSVFTTRSKKTIILHVHIYHQS